jgi:hypothetical protein
MAYGQGFAGNFLGALQQQQQLGASQAQAGNAQWDQMYKLARMQGEVEERDYIRSQRAMEQKQAAAAAEKQQAKDLQLALDQWELRGELPENLRNLSDIDMDTAIKRGFPEAPKPGSQYKVVGTDIFDVSGDRPKIAARGRRTGEPLEQVFDPATGKVTYQPRSQAAGQQVPPKQGITIGPDGTVQIGGSGMSLGNKARGEVETQLVNLSGKMERLGQIQDSFDPRYLQVQERVGQAWNGIKDKLGQLGPEDQAALADFTGWKQAAFNDLNLTLKEMSGAAVTEQEAVRQLMVLPNPGESISDGDSPAVFQRKLNNAIGFTKKAYARLAYIRKNGLESGENFAGIKLDDMPKLADKRGKELEQQIKEQDPGLPPEMVQQLVMQMLAQEFGM